MKAGRVGAQARLGSSRGAARNRGAGNPTRRQPRADLAALPFTRAGIQGSVAVFTNK